MPPLATHARATWRPSSFSGNDLHQAEVWRGKKYVVVLCFLPQGRSVPWGGKKCFLPHGPRVPSGGKKLLRRSNECVEEVVEFVFAIRIDHCLVEEKIIRKLFAPWTNVCAVGRRECFLPQGRLLSLGEERIFCDAVASALCRGRKKKNFLRQQQVVEERIFAVCLAWSPP